jgi:uncharacterized damage-inducible protein DinB
MWWDEALATGIWAASWSKSIEGLTPQQAAWQPPSAPGVAGQRHSIWQIVLHMIFWREGWLRRAATGQKLTKEEIDAGNFPAVGEVSAAGWDQARKQFMDTQSRMSAALKDSSPKNDPLIWFLPHDCYHIGQINYIRAMLGLAAIE